jgi:hypothetical protein
VGDRDLGSDLRLFLEFARRFVHVGGKLTEESCGREAEGRALTEKLEEMDTG